MADFPRITWKDINGRLPTPFTEPQHFTGSGDETVRTGNDNPLPVANYTESESGLWLPTSKENPMPTQVAGSNVGWYSEIEIASGETFRIDRFDAIFANAIVVTLSDRGDNRIRNDLELRVSYYRGDGRALFVYSETIEQVTGNGPGYAKYEFDVLTPTFVIELRNRSEHDGDNIQVNIYGVNK